MIKSLLDLTFVHASMESLKEEEEFLRVICIPFNELSTMPWFILFFIFGKKCSCNQRKLTLF